MVFRRLFVVFNHTEVTRQKGSEKLGKSEEVCLEQDIPQRHATIVIGAHRQR